MQSIVRKAVRPFTVVLKGIILVLIICATGGAWAAVVKPVAVWNRDFANNAVRGGFTFYQSGTSSATANSVSNGIGTVKGQGFVFKRSSAKSFPVTAIVGTSHAAYDSDSIRCLMSFWGNNQNPRYGVSLSTNNYYVGSYNGTMQTTSGTWGIKSSSTSTLEDTDDVHYLAMSHERNSTSGTTRLQGTRFYLDGASVYEATGLHDSYDGNGYQAITVGGLYCSANNYIPEMQMHYLAILDSSSSDDIYYWSNTGVTSAETVATGATITGGSGVGVNLNTANMTATVDGEKTVAALFVQANATLSFASESSKLIVNGPLYIADGVTLTIRVPTFSGETKSDFIEFGATNGKLFADSSTIAVSSSASEDVSIDYTTTENTITFTRKPFSFMGTVGATPGGWFSTWQWNGFSSNLRPGPKSSMGMVYEVKSGEHPGSACEKTSSFSIAFYADVSRMASDGTTKAVMVSLGSGSTGDKMLVMYRQGDYVKLGNWSSGGFTGDWAASVPVTAGYHLYTATFDFDTGAMSLYRDDGTAEGCISSGTPASSFSLPASANGLQIGNVWTGVPSSGNFAIGTGMAFAGMLGFDRVLSASDVAALAAEYPATDGLTAATTIDNRTSDSTVSGTQISLYSVNTTDGFTVPDGNYLGISNGTLDIPTGNVVKAPMLKTLNTNQTGNNVTVNIAGELDVTGATSSHDIYTNRAQNKGILLGHWYGSGTYNITGSLIARDSYMQAVYTAGNQTINVNGGTMAVKGYWGSYANKVTVNLSNNGVIEVKDIMTAGGAPTQNFGYGTFRLATATDGDRTVAFPINFTGTASEPTTLDPYGHTLTIGDANLTGSGYVTVADSSGNNGIVKFVGGSSFTGRIILTDTNYAWVDVREYTGIVECQGTASATLAKLDGFGGTVYFTSNVDVSAIDLSRATVNVADDCTYTATAGNEGTMVLGSGAVATLNVTTDIVNYEGHVPSVSGSGSVAYFNTDTSAAVTGAEYINGNNLLPYYYVWEASETASENTLSSNAASRWKGGTLPATGKNVAFKISGNTTLLVDATVSYGDIQVYGTGTLVFQASDGGVLTVADKLQTTSTTAVQIDSGLAFDTGASLEAVSTLPAYMTAVNCGTSETPFAIPSIVGAGTVYVAEGKVLSLGGADMGTLMALGEISLSGDATVSSLSVFDTGSMTLSEATLTVETTASIEGEVALDSTSHLLVTTSISGAGRVEYTGALPDGSLWATGTATTGWRGTVAIKSYSSSGSNPWYIANYGNANSFLEVDGCTAYYTVASTSGPTLVLVGSGLTIANGNSNDVTTYAGISGSATLTAQGAPTHAYKFGTASGFTGSISNNGRRIVFGSSTPDKDTQSKSITIDSGIEATLGDGAMWTSEKIYLNGTLNVAGSGTLAGAVTAAGSAKIVLSSASLAISGTLTATALEIDTGAISLSTTPTAIITGLTAEPDVAGITVENCNVTTGQADGKYVVYAAYKDTAWSGESGDWTESSFNGGTLATDGEDISFVAGANGAVAVTLTGTRAPANVVFNGGSTSTYTLTGGTFSPSETVTVENGSVTIESAATGTYVVKDGATLSLTNATVTSVSGAGTLNIPAGGVVTLASATALDSLAYITGEGELHVGANIPATTLNTLLKKSYTENDATAYYWRGTVVIEDFVQTNDSTVGGTTLDCGNASSIIQLKNCTIRYFNQFTTRADLEIVGTVKTLNGSGTTYTEFGKLKGTGSFIHENDVRQLYRFTSGTDFTGTIEVRGRRIVFGTDGTGNDTTDRDTYGNTIRISSGYTATLGAGSHWTAYNGVIVYGTMVVKGANSYIEHNDQASKGIVFNDGATIRFDSLSTLKFGNSTLRTPSVASGSTVNIAFGDGVVLGTEPGTEMQLISWGGAPEGDFEFADVTTPKCYRLEKRENGLYLVVKPGTIFSVY